MTKIEWTEKTWNPVRGCTRVSPGCENCYAERRARMMDYPGGAYEGLTTALTDRMDARQRRIVGNAGVAKPRWNGKIRLVPEKLDEPLHWRKPRRVFVNSMSDLFHEDVPPLFIAKVFATMAHARRHTFQVLTKRPERMRTLLDETTFEGGNFFCFLADELEHPGFDGAWPLPNVWLGVSVEDQKRADERIPLLLQTPAAVRFLSAEPLLGPVDLTRIPIPHGLVEINGGELPGLDWVIAGGESGPGARHCNVEWIRSIVEQCREAGVPCFVKQLGAKPTVDHRHAKHSAEWIDLQTLRNRKGGDPDEWPKDLRVREWPA